MPYSPQMDGKHSIDQSLSVVMADGASSVLESASGSPVSFGLEPVGAHSSGATISSATTLTKPSGATAILIQALAQNVRFTLDGTTPTASVGFQIMAGNSPMLIPVPGTSIKVIQEAATASLQYQWVK